MKMPYFRAWDVTPIEVHITQGLTPGGAQNEVEVYSGTCNYSEKVKIVRASDGTLVQLAASLTIGCDIAPGIETINGYVLVNGGTHQWNIATAARPRNPDGSVNHTALGLT
jgi:hypothetical protein